ncbi:MBL fold metallo-hydrolase [Winslowiella iniecta]|uniref:Beta-lactamase n=1 Tax=Winslowiella iniecta TaxID=1560201 RepID=A0A0L7T1M0_9GAMM|nr:MBL fold metallo-hydrolase [Winslowiella iniecta]KOC89131.1 beta-lactamase [Winslowiella iniecta]KOC92973.1 beta-lactamase [Winslowiella iniecta]
MKIRLLLSMAVATLSLSSPLFAASKLNIDVYNPGKASVFAVSSAIISGPSEVALIDAQFQRNDAQELVKRIKATGKKLTTVYISHSDPDYYFGLDTIKAAFPQAKILATPQTIALIDQTKDLKLKYWGPILKENAPQELMTPQPLHGDSFTVDGERIEVKGLQGASPERSWLWVPSLKTVLGGVVVSGNNIHVWLADTQTQQQRADWLKTLDEAIALKPQRVIPGHFLPGADENVKSITFTQDYLRAVEKALPESKNAAELIQIIKAQYPDLEEESGLELSAKVLKGEMSWP